MNNKLKSLLYLSCFIFASVFYNVSMTNEPSEAIVSNVIEQEADIIIQPFMDEHSDIQAN